MRILYVKLGGIGDIVMSLPMIQAMRSRYEDAVISWMCGLNVVSLLQAASGIDEFIVVDETRLLKGSAEEKGKELLRVWRRLFGRRFDLILTGNHDWRYRLLTLTSWALERRSLGKMFGRRVPVPGRYHADEYVRLFSGEEGPEVADTCLPVLRIEPHSADVRKALGEANRPLVAIAPGGAKNVLAEQPLRRWPLERYVDLAKRLIDAGGQVIVTGASSDAWVSPAFANLSVVDLVGKTDLTDLVAVYNVCDAIVVHDSGPFHLAQLSGASVVGLFGPTNPGDFVSHKSRATIFWGGKELACRPCYDGKHFADCPNNVCMQEISVGAVLDALGEVLARATNLEARGANGGIRPTFEYTSKNADVSASRDCCVVLGATRQRQATDGRE
ncbi:MAG: glycosyltransferase family 9 protein [Candidatus Binataceae bacterium]|jgi:heptosyltransferase-2